MTTEIFKTLIPNENQMLAFGTSLANVCDDTAIIYLHGKLGAGKTTLVRGFLSGCGFAAKVKSPTYTIVEPYEVKGLQVFHFDFYRIQNSEELEFLGLEDYFIPHAICLIEWPEQGSDKLPAPDLSCYIESNSKGRKLRVEAYTPSGEKILKKLISLEKNKT